MCNKLLKKMSILGLALTMLCGCTTSQQISSNTSTVKENTDATTSEKESKEKKNTEITDEETGLTYTVDDMSGYYFLGSDVAEFRSISMSETNKFFYKNLTGIIYLGYPGCEYCQRAVPVLNSVAKEYDVPVWYLNAENSYEKSDYSALKAFMSDNLSTDSDGKKQVYTPYVASIKDGKILKWHDTLVDEFEPEDDMDQMSGEQIQKLKVIYEEIFSQIYTK